MSPIADAAPLNAQYDGTRRIDPSRQVATPMITATHGPARIAASVIPIESRKTGSLIDWAIQATTRFRPTSVGMMASFAGFKTGSWELGTANWGGDNVDSRASIGNLGIGGRAYIPVPVPCSRFL